MGKGKGKRGKHAALAAATGAGIGDVQKRLRADRYGGKVHVHASGKHSGIPGIGKAQEAAPAVGAAPYTFHPAEWKDEMDDSNFPLPPINTLPLDSAVVLRQAAARSGVFAQLPSGGRRGRRARASGAISSPFVVSHDTGGAGGGGRGGGGGGESEALERADTLEVVDLGSSRESSMCASSSSSQLRFPPPGLPGGPKISSAIVYQDNDVDDDDDKPLLCDDKERPLHGHKRSTVAGVVRSVFSKPASETASSERRTRSPSRARTSLPNGAEEQAQPKKTAGNKRKKAGDDEEWTQLVDRRAAGGAGQSKSARKRARRRAKKRRRGCDEEEYVPSWGSREQGAAEPIIITLSDSEADGDTDDNQSSDGGWQTAGGKREPAQHHHFNFRDIWYTCTPDAMRVGRQLFAITADHQLLQAKNAAGQQAARAGTKGDGTATSDAEASSTESSATKAPVQFRSGGIAFALPSMRPISVATTLIKRILYYNDSPGKSLLAIELANSGLSNAVPKESYHPESADALQKYVVLFFKAEVGADVKKLFRQLRPELAARFEHVKGKHELRSIMKGLAGFHQKDLATNKRRTRRSSQAAILSAPVDRVILTYPQPPIKGAVTIYESDLLRLEPEEFLNDSIIDFYLQWVVRHIESTEEQERFLLYNTFFYKKISGPKSHGKPESSVLRWTSGVNIFEKEFLLIPMNEAVHWTLAIVLKPGDPDKCRILVFDSLSTGLGKGPRYIRQYLHSMWNAACDEMGPGGEVARTSRGFKACHIPVFSVKGPQQTNFTDCGVFLLHYAELFCKNPFYDPEQIKQNWFKLRAIKAKRRLLKKLISLLSPVLGSGGADDQEAVALVKNWGKTAEVAQKDLAVVDVDMEEATDEEKDGLVKGAKAGKKSPAGRKRKAAAHRTGQPAASSSEGSDVGMDDAAPVPPRRRSPRRSPSPKKAKK